MYYFGSKNSQAFFCVHYIIKLKHTSAFFGGEEEFAVQKNILNLANSFQSITLLDTTSWLLKEPGMILYVSGEDIDSMLMC